MLTNLTANDLIEFENKIAQCFNAAKIKAPVHLYHGNEIQMIEIFEKNNISHDDWVLCSWRSHYQCLLKGVPQDKLMEAILQGRSISLCFKESVLSCLSITTTPYLDPSSQEYSFPLLSMTIKLLFPDSFSNIF